MSNIDKLPRLKSLSINDFINNKINELLEFKNQKTANHYKTVINSFYNYLKKYQPNVLYPEDVKQQIFNEYVSYHLYNSNKHYSKRTIINHINYLFRMFDETSDLNRKEIFKLFDLKDIRPNKKEPIKEISNIKLKEIKPKVVQVPPFKPSNNLMLDIYTELYQLIDKYNIKHLEFNKDTFNIKLNKKKKK